MGGFGWVGVRVCVWVCVCVFVFVSVHAASPKSTETCQNHGVMGLTHLLTLGSGRSTDTLRRTNGFERAERGAKAG